MQHKGLNEEQVGVTSLLFVPARMIGTMGSYSQLTEEQRYQIYEDCKQGLSQTDIGKNIGVNKSTISRELKRNSGLRGYRPRQAHQLAENRKTNCSPSRIICHHWKRVEEISTGRLEP